MRKPPLDPSLFTFSPTAGTVTFAAGATRPTHQGQIVSIVNVSSEVYLYLPVQSGRGGTYNAGTGVLALEIGTATMSSGDALQIVIDDSEIGATSTLQAAGNTLLTALSAKIPTLTLTGTRLQVNPTLATDAATATNQAATNVALGSIDGKVPALSSGRVPVEPSLPAGAATDALQAAINAALGAPADAAATSDTGTYGLVSLQKRLLTLLTALSAKIPQLTLTGTRLQVNPTLGPDASTATNQGISNAALASIESRVGTTGAGAPTLPSGASGLAGLWQLLREELLGRLPATGVATAAAQPMFSTAGTPSGDVLTVQGAGAGEPIPVVASPAAPINSVYQQATPGPLSVNTMLIGPIDCAKTRMLSIQCISIGTGGLVVAEWALDSSFSVGVFTAQLINATSGVAVTTFAVGNFSTNVYALWFRLRLSTATTGGTVHVQLQQWSEISFTPSVQAVTPVPGSVFSQAAASVTTDVVSATISASVTSTSVTLTSGLGFVVEIPVSGMSGTNAWVDFRIEQSGDTGATWHVIYDFPRIAANGQYRSPALALGGNRWRYVQTLNTGTQLTRSITRVVSNAAVNAIRQRYDRTISLTTASSATPALIVSDCRNLQMVVRADAIGTTAPVVQMQGTEDDWQSSTAAWYNIGNALTADAARPVSVTVTNVNTQAIRGIVTTAGSGGTTTLNYVLLKGF